MSVSKPIMTGLAGLAFFALGLPAIAQEKAYEDYLTVSNNTAFDSTTKSNGLFCSTKLGAAIGVTKAGEQNHKIDRKLVYIACATNSSNCSTEVFLSNNCSGPSIATVIFDARRSEDAAGLISVTMHDTRYRIDGTGFNITINNT